jgi:N-methylhydantoinase B
MREVLGGGAGGRYYADGEDTIHVVPDSRNIPVEFAESRWPFVVERLGLAVDSGGPGRHRGGLGYDKHIRMLRDARFMSIADRSVLSCWGVNGGRAGRPFSVVIDPGGPNERVADALADGAPVRAGEVIRIRTTGGGGWGDPLTRPYDEVERDVRWGKVSVAGAREDYGVVIADGVVDAAASDELRAALASRTSHDTAPFFDRGPGYATLSGGRPHADVDFVIEEPR